MLDLEVGQEVWGYIAPEVTVLNTPYQEYGEVTRLEDRKYRAKRAGRPDYTGFEDFYPTLQQALVASGLSGHASGKVVKMSPTILRLLTCFDSKDAIARAEAEEAELLALLENIEES